MLTVAELELLDLAITQGMAYFTALQERRAAGAATIEDLNNATAKLDMDVESMLQARAEQRIREKATKDNGMQVPTTPGPATTPPKEETDGKEFQGEEAKKSEKDIPVGAQPTGPN